MKPEQVFEYKFVVFPRPEVSGEWAALLWTERGEADPQIRGIGSNPFDAIRNLLTTLEIDRHPITERHLK